MTKIAIVEDNKVIRESLMEFVQTDPECECVYACATAKEALKELPKRPGHRPDGHSIAGYFRHRMHGPPEATDALGPNHHRDRL